MYYWSVHVIHIRFSHHDERNVPGSVANTKLKFHHRKAGKDVKVETDFLSLILTNDTQDFYACVDLLDSTFRLNVTAFARQLMAQRAPITTLSGLEQLVADLLDMFNIWDKFKKTGLNSVPILTTSEEKLQLATASDAPSIVDRDHTTPAKLARLEEEDEVGQDDGHVRSLQEEQVKPASSVAEQEDVEMTDEYREYMKGKENGGPP